VLRDEFARLGVEAEIAQDPAVAIGQALKKAEENDLICATGSLFVAAEVIEYMKCLRGGGAARRVGRKSLFG
jgi:folylpolyglutamate synthase/dihydropteroate synthase